MWNQTQNSAVVGANASTPRATPAYDKHQTITLWKCSARIHQNKSEMICQNALPRSRLPPSPPLACLPLGFAAKYSRRKEVCCGGKRRRRMKGADRSKAQARGKGGNLLSTMHDAWIMATFHTMDVFLLSYSRYSSPTRKHAYISNNHLFFSMHSSAPCLDVTIVIKHILKLPCNLLLQNSSYLWEKLRTQDR